jgi:DNA-binding winged helix-turn-helix (wHTH) protein
MKYFPPFRFDDLAGVLTHAGRTVPLTRKAADLLRCLLARPGALVSHQEILRGVWPDTHVQPENVKALVHELRSALGDHSHDPVFIRSETGRGYTFIADVTSAMVPFLGRDDGPEDQLFVNREEELALIDRRLATAANTGEPQLVVLEGERGVGKTSLCQAVVRMARRRPGLRITYGQCPEVSGPVEPYGVLIDALDLLARQHPVAVPAAFARRAPDWLARFPHWREAEPRRLPPTGTSGGEDLLMRDLAGVLDELAADTPLLLILEDLQWGDAATVEWLRAVMRRRGPARLCIVATYCASRRLPIVDALERVVRSVRSESWCEGVRLESLSVFYVQQYLQRRFGGDVAAGIAAALHAATGGNPLLTVMASDALVRRGSVRLSSAGWHLEGAPRELDAALAASLADGLQCQIDRLDAEDRFVLEAAAAAGPQFTVEAVATVLGTHALRAIARRLDALVAREMLVSAGYRFRHPIIVDLLLAQAPLARQFQATERLERNQDVILRRA